MSASSDFPLIRAIVIKELRRVSRGHVVTGYERRASAPDCPSATDISWRAPGLRNTAENHALVERILKELTQDGITQSTKWKGWTDRQYCLTEAFVSITEDEYDLLREHFPAQWRKALRSGPEMTRSYVERARRVAEEKRSWSGLGGIVSRSGIFGGRQ